MVGRPHFKIFDLQTGERECISKTDLPIIIWKWTLVDVCCDLEIGAHLLGWSESLSCSRAGKLKGISPDDWALTGPLAYVTKHWVNWFLKGALIFHHWEICEFLKNTGNVRTWSFWNSLMCAGSLKRPMWPHSCFKYFIYPILVRHYEVY